MIIKREEWDAVAEFRKSEIGKCELCQKPFDPRDLRARHLRYEPDVDDKYMIILCSDCNNDFHIAEVQENMLMSSLNTETMAKYQRLHELEFEENKSKTTEIMRLLTNYSDQRSEIISDAIAAAVKTRRTRKRAEIDGLFRRPNAPYEKDLWRLCDYYGVNNVRSSLEMDSKKAKEKIEILRQKEKEEEKKKKKMQK